MGKGGREERGGCVVQSGEVRGKGMLYSEGVSVVGVRV